MHSRSVDKLIFFVAILATTLALGGALAHLYELPNKIGLERDEYFIVQNIYEGWNQLAYVLLFEMATFVAILVNSRKHQAVFRPAAFALLFLIASQVVFWVYTFPANAATDNWTVIPENWELLRRNWEYSHAAGAVFQLLAMCCLIVAVLSRPRDQ